MRVSAVGGDLVHSSEPEVRRLMKSLAAPLGTHRPTLPAVSGGLTPGNLHKTLAICGTDILVLAGRGIASHPQGIKAGVAALRAAEDAFISGVEVREYSRAHPELAAAL